MRANRPVVTLRIDRSAVLIVQALQVSGVMTMRLTYFWMAVQCHVITASLVKWLTHHHFVEQVPEAKDIDVF